MCQQESNMLLKGFALIILGTQMGLVMMSPGLYDLNLDKASQNCKELTDHTHGCLIHDLEDASAKKCWVTSHYTCDAERYVGEGSICQHTVTGATNRCLKGEWTTEEIKSVAKNRVRRWCIWCRSRRRTRYEHIKDNPPSIRCPSDITKNASSGETTAVVTYSQPTASDDRGAPSVSRIQGPSSGSLFNEGTTLVRYRATDSSGSSSECHFSVTVQVHSCSSLPRFLHGSRNCTGPRDNIFGSSCSHTCNTGYTLQGNDVVNCSMENGTTFWEEPFPNCTAVSCGSPGTVLGARVQCPAGVTFNKTCNVLCNAGYRHSGAKFITCTSSGQWTQLSPCTDSEAPRFPEGCPASKTIFSGPLRAPVALTWDDPVTTDNSGGLVTLNSEPRKGSRLGPGTHTVTITATDAAGNNDSCSFSISVEARECEPLANPANGGILCTLDNVEGSVCSVSCNDGYVLQGQANLTCLATEQWDADVPTCQAVVCPAPPSIDHGQFSCPNGRQYPAECNLTCDAGYEVRGRTTIQCALDGNWTTQGICADVEPPVFDDGCKSDIVAYAAPLGQQTFVNMTAPTASDNSGDAISVTSNINSESAFPPGTTVVTYTATDASGNSNSCNTNVTVSVLHCDAPDLQPRSGDENDTMQESCPDGHVHGARCTLNCTHGYRLQGRDTITCERDDSTHPPTMSWKWSGTDEVRPKCMEDNCPPLSAPENGALSCYLGNQGWECFMSCEAAWDVPDEIEGRFVCPNDVQLWSPSFVPDCRVRTRPGRVRMLSDLLYFTGSCNTSTEQLRYNFISRINQTIYGGACAITPTCVAENIEVFCRPVPSSRRKRADINAALRPQRDVSRLMSHVIVVTFHVTMPYEEDLHSPEEAYKKYQREADNFARRLKSQAQSGFFDMDDLELVADGRSLGDTVLQADCPPGTVFKVMRPQTRLSCVPEKK